MQRWTSVVVGVLSSAALVAAMYQAGAPASRGTLPTPSASASAPPSASAAPAPSGSAGEEDLAGPSLLPAAEEVGDGGKPLPANAPGTVSFGVVLFTYQGVQFAPTGARTKQEALEKAKAVVEDAKRDFPEAVKKGDRGSTADAGRIPRGVLEPEIEAVLFTLDKGAVHPEPVDTPRGYWVLRRIE
ncbi:MAG: peptidylprolyl isomerase [Myxococcales bacterium]|nr:peptidylprolyl isomerase [Myxococcales bacterium]